jgi:(R,R)-butanediol dehydrogenase/meso-butanediol dehydrogenase/diacetyl reductase
MKNSMKVPFVHGPHDLRLGDVPLPEAGPEDAVVRVATVGICGSDLGYVAVGGIAGPTGTPIPLGHELCGIIEQLGANVTMFERGQRVLINPLINYIGNGGPEGGFAEKLLVRNLVENPHSLVPMPDGMSFDDGALVEPLAVATHAVKRTGVDRGGKIAIYGAGPIGLGAIVVLRHRGVEDIVVFDLSPLRRARALQLGARAAFDPREKAPSELLSELHGTALAFGVMPCPGTTHYLEASGAPVLPDIVGFARPGAIITVVSVHKKPVTLDFQLVMGKELTITTAMAYPNEFPEVLEMLQAGNIDLKPMVTHHFAGSDFMNAFATAKRQEEACKVLVQYDLQG